MISSADMLISARLDWLNNNGTHSTAENIQKATQPCLNQNKKSTKNAPRRGIGPRSPTWQARILTTILSRNERKSLRRLPVPRPWTRSSPIVAAETAGCAFVIPSFVLCPLVFLLLRFGPVLSSFLLIEAIKSLSRRLWSHLTITLFYLLTRGWTSSSQSFWGLVRPLILSQICVEPAIRSCVFVQAENTTTLTMLGGTPITTPFSRC